MTDPITTFLIAYATANGIPEADAAQIVESVLDECGELPDVVDSYRTILEKIRAHTPEVTGG